MTKKQFLKALGKGIRSHRERAGLTQVALAKKVHVEPTYISVIENGRKEPSLALVRDIMSACGKNISDLIVFNTEETK